MKSYDHGRIEKKWQKEWESQGIYRSQKDTGKPKAYVLDMFPYPSGDGLHVGHPKGYIATDIYSRHARMQGKNVLHPMGWDAFGLPAENFAIKNKVHPRAAVEKNVARFKEQLQKIGLDYDWSREINTTDPEYYKWTQWIFLKLLEKGLAYEAYEPINWCPSCQTGLANEDLDNGVCERCGSQVEKKPMRQWTLKITDYAERLLNDLELLPEWQEHIKESQRNWIGKSEGAEIEFAIDAIKKGTRFVILHGKHGSPERDFLPWLRVELEKRGFNVQVPAMPNASEPDDIEQADYIEKNCVLDENTLIIGHSFGGIVALRLAERGHKLEGIHMIGTPFSGIRLDGKPGGRSFLAIQRGFDFELIKNNVKNGALVYDINDDVIPPSDGDGYAGKLGWRLSKVRAEDGHFNSPIEPSVLDSVAPTIKVFTTRPDTLFGVTYMVVSPEHPILAQLAFTNKDAVVAYAKEAAAKSEIERTAEGKEKSGVKLEGVSAINPANGAKIPVYVADYVLAHYGTGAIMAVPAHDERDQQFAQKFGLPVIQVVGDNGLMNSGEFDGLTSQEAKQKITAKYGVAKVSYKLRDWVFSRQRYWGEPIPVVHCEKDGTVPVPYDQLPVKLPEVEHYEPTGTGESPLANIAEWVNTTCPKCRQPAKRETNTMPQWAGSSWYYLRYMDPKNDRALVDPAKEKYWAPVDMYVGGAEHATRHLIYARFWHKFLKDIGAVSTDESFKRLISVGLIMAEDGRKMSKRYGNVINPDDIVETYGADTLRIYEMFMGPFTDAIAWKTSSLIGARRFLERVWRLQETFATEADADVERVLNQTIKKVGEDIGNFKFNTAISQMMIFVNEAEEKGVTKEQYQSFITILAPFAPHIADEIWHELGNASSVNIAAWPAYDESKLLADTVTLAVQVNGKARAEITLLRDASQADAEKAAKEAAAKWLEGKEPQRVIFVANRLVNLVLAK